MIRLLVLLVLSTLVSGDTDPSQSRLYNETRLAQIETAVIRLIECEMRWRVLSYERPEGDLITHFLNLMDRIEAERIAYRRAEEERRSRDEEEWRRKRYSVMLEACRDYPFTWLTKSGYLDCCQYANGTRIVSKVACDLETGTPGHYYKAMINLRASPVGR